MTLTTGEIESTSNGFAKKLEINFHKRSGNKKEEKILVVDSNWYSKE